MGPISFPVRRWMHGGLARRLVVAVAVLAGMLAGCGSSGPSVPQGAHRVPVYVKRKDGLVLGAYVRVMVLGHPYTFLVDTGAGQTFVSSTLASRLGLGPLSAPTTADTIGCSTTIRTGTIRNWSLGGIPLPTSTVAAQTITGAGQTVDGAPYAGLLGASVWATFGTMRLSTKTGQLILGGALRTGPAHSAAMQVLRGHGEVAGLVEVDIGGKTDPWVVDTGADISFAGAATGQAVQLDEVTTKPITVHSPNCTSTVHLVDPGPWTLNGFRLPNIDLSTGPSKLPKPIGGLLGEDIISNYGSVTLDFTRQRVSWGD